MRRKRCDTSAEPQPERRPLPPVAETSLPHQTFTKGKYFQTQRRAGERRRPCDFLCSDGRWRGSWDIDGGTEILRSEAQPSRYGRPAWRRMRGAQAASAETTGKGASSGVQVGGNCRLQATTAHARRDAAAERAPPGQGLYGASLRRDARRGSTARESEWLAQVCSSAPTRAAARADGPTSGSARALELRALSHSRRGRDFQCVCGGSPGTRRGAPAPKWTKGTERFRAARNR